MDLLILKYKIQEQIKFYKQKIYHNLKINKIKIPFIQKIWVIIRQKILVISNSNKISQIQVLKNKIFNKTLINLIKSHHNNKLSNKIMINFLDKFINLKKFKVNLSNKFLKANLIIFLKLKINNFKNHNFSINQNLHKWINKRTNSLNLLNFK